MNREAVVKELLAAAGDLSGLSMEKRRSYAHDAGTEIDKAIRLVAERKYGPAKNRLSIAESFLKEMTIGDSNEHWSLRSIREFQDTIDGILRELESKEAKLFARMKQARNELVR